MSRIARTLNQGEVKPFTVPVKVNTTSSGSVYLPNNGVTVLSSGQFTGVAAVTSGELVLDAPDMGVKKVIICLNTSSSSSNTWVVRGSTAATVKFDNQAATQISLGGASTIDQVVTLIGVNSTRWAVVNSIGSPTIGTS